MLSILSGSQLDTMCEAPMSPTCEFCNPRTNSLYVSKLLRLYALYHGLTEHTHVVTPPRLLTIILDPPPEKERILRTFDFSKLLKIRDCAS